MCKGRDHPNGIVNQGFKFAMVYLLGEYFFGKNLQLLMIGADDGLQKTLQNRKRNGLPAVFARLKSAQEKVKAPPVFFGSNVLKLSFFRGLFFCGSFSPQIL